MFTKWLKWFNREQVQKSSKMLKRRVFRPVHWYARVQLLIQKSVWRSSVSRVGFRSKMQFWSTLFLFEMDQNCDFEQFESGPKLQFDTWSEPKRDLDQFRKRLNFRDHVSNCNFDPLSNCSTLQFWSTENRVDQNYIFERNQPRDTELLQTLF